MVRSVQRSKIVFLNIVFKRIAIGGPFFDFERGF